MDSLNAASAAVYNLAQTATVVAAPVEALLDVTGALSAIETGIHQLSQGMPILMKALDACSAAHPFISGRSRLNRIQLEHLTLYLPCCAVAVLALKAVYTLEMKRRANDAKIIALYVEMKNMISVLVQYATELITQVSLC